MESIPRPLHRNHVASVRLSSVNGFAKNAYDDVFSGPRKLRVPSFSSGVEDYHEIFGGSRASTIPILDLSALEETNTSPDFRSPKSDYSKVFGGFHEDDIGVPFEELFAGQKRSKTSSGRIRNPVTGLAGLPKQETEHMNFSKENQLFSSEAHDQMFDGVKQFNMCYNKTSQRVKDGTKGATHIAQLGAVPGFTCFIDEIATPNKTKGHKPKSPETKDVPHNVDVSMGVMEGKHRRNSSSQLISRQTSEGKHRRNSSSHLISRQTSEGSSYSSFESFPHPSEVSPPPSQPTNLKNNKGHSNKLVSPKFEASKSDASDSRVSGNCTPSFSDEELDLNSAAAASIYALRKALEQAQECIRIAKESMEREKGGPQTCSEQSSKCDVRVKGTRKIKIVHEKNRIEENVKEKIGRVDSAFHSVDKTERTNASSEVTPDIKNSGKLYFATEVVKGMDKKNLGSATWFSKTVNSGTHAVVQLDGNNNTMQSDASECKVKEMKTARKALDQQKGSKKEVKAVKETFAVKDTVKMVQLSEEYVNAQESTCFVDEKEDERLESTKNFEKNDEKDNALHELEECDNNFKEFQEKRIEKKFVSMKLNDNISSKRQNDIKELAENEEQHWILEQEQLEKRMDVRESCENSNRETIITDGKDFETSSKEVEEQNVELYDGIHVGNPNDRGVDKRFKEAYQWDNGKVLLKEACGNENNKMKEEKPKKGEEIEIKLVETFEMEIDEKRPSDAHQELASGSENNELKEEEPKKGQEIERKLVETSELEIDEKRPSDAHQEQACGSENNELKEEEPKKGEEIERKLVETSELEIDEKRPSDAHQEQACGSENNELKKEVPKKGEEIERKLVETLELEIVENRCSDVHQEQACGSENNEMKEEEPKKGEEIERKLVETFELEIGEAQVYQAFGSERNEMKDESRKVDVTERKLKEIYVLEIDENRQSEEQASGSKINEMQENESRIGEEAERKLDNSYELQIDGNMPSDNQIEQTRGSKSEEIEAKEPGMGEETEREPDEAYQLENDHKVPSNIHAREGIEKIPQKDCMWEGNEEILRRACDHEKTESLLRESDQSKIEEIKEAVYDNNLDNVADMCEEDKSNSRGEIQNSCRQEVNGNNMEEIQDLISNKKNGRTSYKPADMDTLKAGESVKNVPDADEIRNSIKDASDAPPASYVDLAGMIELEKIERNDSESKSVKNLENGIEIMINNKSRESEEYAREIEIALDEAEIEGEFETASDEKQWMEEVSYNVQSPRAPTSSVEEMEIAEELETRLDTGKNDDNVSETSAMEEKETEETFQGEEEMERDRKFVAEKRRERRKWEKPFTMEENETEEIVQEEKENTRKFGAENKRERKRWGKPYAMEEKETEESVQKEEGKEHARNIEAENKKERRKWEKDRIAVERAIREARERAFAEARERAERAAVEKANAEVRQRVLAEGREKTEKASIGSKSSSDKVSIEARLKAERAAVERATVEARERALEKALSQKTIPETKTQAERCVSEKFSGASKDNGLKHSFSSSDLDRFDGTSNEATLRHKATLERHQRIMERATRALEEKNTRDLLAQKEQAERNRIADVLDADIKRWASGKEGNLRALLSTLQYILGSDSGWQPISLTEIVTTSAVRKAYRKATLYVHPDKLQQRGASIQQKYTCEKVFDLLKAAWNKFNSEER